MTSLVFSEQLAALREVVFGAIDAWNGAHPHPLGSHRERGSVNVTHVFADATGAPSYSVVVCCPLSGSTQLTFHGHDLAMVVEHARLTLERRIGAELLRRAEKERDDEFDGRFGLAV
jgi:hypothetical protein